MRDLKKNNGFEPDEVRELAAVFPHLLVIERHEQAEGPAKR